MKKLIHRSFHFARVFLRAGLSLPVLVLVISNVVFASDPLTEYQKANGLYQRQQYDSAALIYGQLIGQEYHAAEVYFNLANCYYRQDHIAKAILNYERALKLSPDDEDIAFNLKVAQLKVVDKIEAVPEIFYVRWMKSLSNMFTTDGWSRVIIGGIWVMFFFAAVYVLSRSGAIKRTGFLFAAIFFVLTLCTWILSRQSYADHVTQKSAVVMNVSAYVKSSPGDSNTDLFLLHEGTKVDILDEFDNWVKIRIANGSIGWLKDTEIEEI